MRLPRNRLVLFSQSISAAEKRKFSFTTRPPKGSQFGRTSSDAGVNLLAPRHPDPSLQIMCVNPATFGGGAGVLEPYVPTLVLGLTGNASR